MQPLGERFAIGVGALQTDTQTGKTVSPQPAAEIAKAPHVIVELSINAALCIQPKRRLEGRARDINPNSSSCVHCGAFFFAHPREPAAMGHNLVDAVISIN